MPENNQVIPTEYSVTIMSLIHIVASGLAIAGLVVGNTIVEAVAVVMLIPVIIFWATIGYYFATKS